jgi:hypothetical protein
VHARWSHSYNKVNTVVYYSAVEVYLHTFSAIALGGDMQLTSRCDEKITAERTADTY